MPALDFDKLRIFFATQPVTNVWLFGSFARGEEHDNSDVDFLVRFDKSAKIGLLRHADMMISLEKILNRKVDIVPDNALYPELRKYVDADKILIYER